LKLEKKAIEVKSETVFLSFLGFLTIITPNNF
jgi:hypothetical protein